MQRNGQKIKHKASCKTQVNLLFLSQSRGANMSNEINEILKLLFVVKEISKPKTNKKLCPDTSQRNLDALRKGEKKL